MRGHTAAIGIFTAVVATACLSHDPTDPTTTGTTTTGTGTGEPTTGLPACPYTCPAPPTCQETVCVEGECALAFLPEGSVWPSTPGDCRHDVCDGEGGLMSVLADDPPNQIPGDCQRYVCDGGDAVVQLDASDVPDDDNDCTADTCEDGTPTNTPKPMHTACGPGLTQYCHDTGQCRPCKQVTDACEDYGFEPHENQETAHNLGAITDDDDDGSFVCGTIRGANDVDWYTVGGKDQLGNFVDPVRNLVAQNGDGGRICVYFDCNNGGTSVNCGNATADTAPLGQKGCCSTGSVAAKLDCGGFDDGTQIWFRVDSPGGLACVPYQVDYHF
jgi:hypothetical protein